MCLFHFEWLLQMWLYILFWPMRALYMLQFLYSVIKCFLFNNINVLSFYLGKAKRVALSELTGTMSRAAGRKITRIISFSKRKPPLPGDTQLPLLDEDPRCGEIQLLHYCYLLYYWHFLQLSFKPLCCAWLWITRDNHVQISVFFLETMSIHIPIHIEPVEIQDHCAENILKFLGNDIHLINITTDCLV